MIEQALYEHLIAQDTIAPFLTTYNGTPAVFNQEAPADDDPLWADGPQYGRIVFAVDIQGDPERTMGGTLSVDIMLKDGGQPPEELEPLARAAIDGYFFSSGTFSVAAQWKNSSYFTQPTEEVNGCTITFDLLAFPMMTTSSPDVIQRINEWTAAIDGLHVINFDPLPTEAWKPTETETAVYWRLLNDNPAGWIPDTFQTIWRTATIKGHIFAATLPKTVDVAREIILRLYGDKRLTKPGESQIMVNQRNTADYGADPLRTGQITVEGTYGVIVHLEPDRTLENINY